MKKKRIWKNDPETLIKIKYKHTSDFGAVRSKNDNYNNNYNDNDLSVHTDEW